MPVGLLSLLLMATPVGAVPSTSGDEIVVMGQQLDRWTGKFEIRGARRKCSTKTSSGDPEIDAVGCQAFLTCADQYQPETDASDERGIDQATRRARKETLISDMRDCIADQRVVLLTQLNKRRTSPAPR